MSLRTTLLPLALIVGLSLMACSAESSGPEGTGEDDVTASTTLTFPLIAHEYKGEGEWVTVPLESLNAEAAKAGLKPFAKSITVGRSEADKKKFQAIVDAVETLKDKTGRDIEFMQDWDASKYVGLCHTGSLQGVRLTVEALRGVAFSEYMGMSGYRFKNTKKFLYGMDEKEFFDGHLEQGNDAEVKAWEEFDTNSDAFLMLTDGGQQGDGTELFAVTIPKCQ